MSLISEAEVEGACISALERLGYASVSENDIGPDGHKPEREAYSDVILQNRLEQAVERLNPHIPAEARHDAVTQILATQMPSLEEENRRLHKAMTDGIGVEFYAEDGTIRGDRVRLIDFDDPAANDWLVVCQFTVVENRTTRRPDVVATGEIPEPTAKRILRLMRDEGMLREIRPASGRRPAIFAFAELLNISESREAF